MMFVMFRKPCLIRNAGHYGCFNATYNKIYHRDIKHYYMPAITSTYHFVQSFKLERSLRYEYPADSRKAINFLMKYICLQY